MKYIGLIFLSIFSAVVPAAAHADYMFSGSGSSGALASSSEIWNFNFDGDIYYPNLTDWGSPGVNGHTTAYGETSAAYGFEITFSGGGAISTALVSIGSDPYCLGITTFCRFSGIGPPAAQETWEAFQIGPDSIDFLAQSPIYDITQGEDYFVNIFFDGATPTSFTGTWLTSFTAAPPTVTPEPTSLLLLGTGLIGLAGQLGLRRAKRNRRTKSHGD